MPSSGKGEAGRWLTILAPIAVIQGEAVGSVHHPIQHVAQWAREYYQRAKRLLDEALDRQVRLKQALEDLAQANAQLTRLNSLTQGLRQPAEDARAAKEQFVANVSHELRGALRYPSDNGGWQLGDLDFSEHLAKYRDHEVIVVIASVGKAVDVEKEKYVRGICGFALAELGACPRCKMQTEKTAKGLRRRQQKEAFLREVDEFLDGKWEDSEAEGDR